MAKSYKNVYTILEKVKKGEIDTHYKDKDGLFGKINFYKKPDLIKPYLHYIDEDRLKCIMDAHINDDKVVNEMFNKFTSSADFKKMTTDKQPDKNAFQKKFRENYNKFPNHISKDIFKMFYNKIDRLNFEERTEVNHTKFKFLERANNPVGKIMTEYSSLKSAVFTKNIMAYFIGRLTMLDYVDPNASKDIQNGLNGSSDFDNDGVDKAMSDMMDSRQGKNMLEDAMDKAQELCQKMDDCMDKDTQEEMFKAADRGGESSSAGKLNIDYLNNVESKLQKIKFSMGSLKEKIKKLLDKSVSYFSSKTETKYEDLFNSDNIAGLDDYVLLHPDLRKIFIEDLQVKTTKNIGKIDIYIDISGSMDGGCGMTNEKGDHITKLDFCKSFAAKLKSMDMLNDIYVFNTKVRKVNNDLISISMMNSSGGTTIDEAVRSINKNGNNALIITDAEDRCNIYSDKAFFIGVKGSSFSYFNSSVIQEYSNNQQVVVFNGDSILKVDENGRTIV